MVQRYFIQNDDFFFSKYNNRRIIEPSLQQLIKTTGDGFSIVETSLISNHVTKKLIKIKRKIKTQLLQDRSLYDE